MASSILATDKIEQLSILVQEAIRSTDRSVKRFVEPAHGTLQQATSRTHSIVFGRRGSGKSSLLRKAAADLTLDRRPIAYIDLETFKGHSYPDVLLSVLIKTFEEFAVWLRTAAIHPSTKTSFWTKLFGTTPHRPSFNRKEAKQLAELLEQQIKALKELLFASDEREIQRIHKLETDKSTQRGGEAEASPVPGTLNFTASAGQAWKTSSSEEVHETYQSTKVEFLHRHILDYQDIFRSMAEMSDGDSYLFSMTFTTSNVLIKQRS
jgi:hypothetical protein